MKRKIETFHVDPASLCQTLEEQEALLNDAWETGETRVFANALKIVARARAGGLRQLTEKTGLSFSAVHKATSTAGNPTLTSLFSLFKAMGIEARFSVHRDAENG